jgi:hypothetical protein
MVNLCVMRRLLTGLLVIAILITVGDLFVKHEAEARVADQVAASFELRNPPDVDIEGFPFVWNALRGRLPGLTVSTDRVRKEGVRFDSFEARFHDLTFEPSAVLSGKADVEARSGDGQVTVPLATVNQLLTDQASAVFQVEIRGDDVVAETGGQQFPATVELDGDSLVITPEGLAAVSLDLPSIRRGVTFEGVETIPEGFRIHFTLIDDALKLTN